MLRRETQLALGLDVLGIKNDLKSKAKLDIWLVYEYVTVQESDTKKALKFNSY